MEKNYCTAIVLAAGKGKRMGTKIHKQYLSLGGYPLIYYSLRAFASSPLIDEIILVAAEGEEIYCKKEIVEKYNIEKVSRVVAGGKERYHSVWNGLQLVEKGYVFVHDGARPFVDEGIIERAYEAVTESRACVVGMPVKDTVKLSDENGYVKETPERSRMWTVQTPQVFDTELLKKAFQLLMSTRHIQVTDDAMVVEQMLGHPIKLVQGSYENIKITTPEDLEVAELFLNRRGIRE